MTDRDPEWWKEATVYQLYPRSFNDSDGDGIGDLPGIREKIPYIDDLGVDVVWLNPVYDSPGADGGYDIRDYYAVDDDYGTMADLEGLLADLQARDIRLIMDLVVNHTSDEHEWFRRSRRGDPEYADFYHWVPGDPDEPPNDWESFFGGPAWSYDESRGSWYLHLFDERQPDLNWRTPEVREAIYEMMRWWLEKGIDGFRLDVINLISKPEGYPDAGSEGIVRGADRFVNGPRIHEYVDEIYGAVFADYDAMTVGEMVELSIDDAPRFVGPDGHGMSMAFSFDHMRLDMDDGRWDHTDWSVAELRRVIRRWQTELDGWNALYLGNHDQPRMVSRFGDDGEYRRESATLLATLLFTLRGTPFVYQGDELGMTNYPFESLDDVVDVDTVNNVTHLRESGAFESHEEMMDLVRYRSRDNARTPMQWTGDEGAGFTTGEPWLPVNPNYDRINAERQAAAPDSVLAYYRRLVDLRASEEVLVYGDYEPLSDVDELPWTYRRTLDDERALVALNFGSDESSFSHPYGDAELLIGNYPDPGPAVGGKLRPWEAVVYSLD